MIKITSLWNHQDKIKVEWNLGKRCNYNCGYCPEEIHDNYSRHTDINILTATVDKLSSLNALIRLSLTGGEPSVHPRIETLIEHIKSKNMWLNITTNGTRKREWYDAQPVDQYVFSLHFEYDWNNVLNTIVSVAKNTTKSVFVNVMAHHKHMSDVKSAVTLLRANNVEYVIRRIRWTEDDRDDFDDNRYTSNDLNWILDSMSTVKPNTVLHITETKIEQYHANDIIKLHKNNFRDWSCKIGLESLMINWDGEVHRATCRVGGSLGNIYSGTFEMPIDPVTCTREWCTCAADIPISKWKN